MYRKAFLFTGLFALTMMGAAMAQTDTKPDTEKTAPTTPNDKNGKNDLIIREEGSPSATPTGDKETIAPGAKSGEKAPSALGKARKNARKKVAQADQHDAPATAPETKPSQPGAPKPQ
ncbi:MAG: hypothetical protein H6585_10940 [Flavobacteriales bacterium]|nr:hypothetical protein [Flavobacteriales bacterium]MCB9448849.1 hypothetical protein [Flavobacteriales bacterium]